MFALQLSNLSSGVDTINCVFSCSWVTCVNRLWIRFWKCDENVSYLTEIDYFSSYYISSNSELKTVFLIQNHSYFFQTKKVLNESTFNLKCDYNSLNINFKSHFTNSIIDLLFPAS